MNQNNEYGSYLELDSMLNDTYKLTGYLASSELSIVYLGYSVESGESVVIKEYYPKALVMRDMDNKTVISRKPSAQAHIDRLREAFLREAAILKGLQHKNIVGFMNDFEQNETSYLVTAYCRGQTLESYIHKNHPMARADWVRKTLIPLLEGIQYMHDQGIIHRDLKPGNVMVGEDGSPQVIDFGSAIHLNTASSYPIMTSAGFSPLELYSDKSKQGTYSDMFSLAAIIYYVLTGQVPMDISQRLIQDNLPSVRKLNNKVGVVLSCIIMWGMAVKFAKRCPSLRVMKATLHMEYYRLKGLDLSIGKLKKTEKPTPRL
ncbi:serine/threonine protein kinase [Paenibacillus alba]|uniref:serine/threonine protein kinase n=1 Tax=Paenibacillus alba TaxID=1197127 RepID=UPI001564D7B6|nr:serine/threonine-protein kinase [Paenibacillus alba]NQX66885.1 serine/threonine protein kinase [Paenibacillus alba]